MEELHEAELLLQVVDGSNQEAQWHMKIGDEFLDGLVVKKCGMLSERIQNTIVYRLKGVLI